jgi:hypothetical protein
MPPVDCPTPSITKVTPTGLGEKARGSISWDDAGALHAPSSAAAATRVRARWDLIAAQTAEVDQLRTGVS